MFQDQDFPSTSCFLRSRLALSIPTSRYAKTSAKYESGYQSTVQDNHCLRLFPRCILVGMLPTDLWSNDRTSKLRNSARTRQRSGRWGRRSGAGLVFSARTNVQGAELAFRAPAGVQGTGAGVLDPELTPARPERAAGSRCEFPATRRASSMLRRRRRRTR